MRKYWVSLVAVVCISVFASMAFAQESYYIRKTGPKYQQAVNRVNSADNSIRSIQASLTSQRNAFNQGMASKNQGVRARAKNNFLRYMQNLINAYLNSERAYNDAIYWGGRYATGMMQLSSKAARGRQVAAQVRGLKTARLNIINTRKALNNERAAAARRY